ncbi:GlcG/HbpS family heme-binding protein [Chryseobacterium aquaeductus]|uniref:GlcG/HbpS family heme-binding protein n=1 Tax=Chryseobacterium aquaeductus TaxID=2675056 RepID=UPI00192AC05F
MKRNEPLYNIEHSNNGLITFPGGVLIKDSSGNIIGSIGVSGSSVEDDHEVASAGAAALG